MLGSKLLMKRILLELLNINNNTTNCMRNIRNCRANSNKKRFKCKRCKDKQKKLIKTNCNN